MSRIGIETRATIKVRFLALFLALLMVMTPVAAFAQDATPSPPGSLKELGSQSKKLDGKDKIWQIDKVPAKPKDQEAEKFKVDFGYIFAYQIPITVTVDSNDPVDLDVGEALPINGGDIITAASTTDELGSFYTIEIISVSEIDTELNRQVIGSPFSTEAADHTMTLSVGTLDPGAEVPVRTVDLPALVLVLQGELIHLRTDEPAATLSPGYAAAGFGSGSVKAGNDGATFILAELTVGPEGTPVVE